MGHRSRGRDARIVCGQRLLQASLSDIIQSVRPHAARKSTYPVPFARRSSIQILRQDPKILRCQGMSQGRLGAFANDEHDKTANVVTLVRSGRIVQQGTDSDFRNSRELPPAAWRRESRSSTDYVALGWPR